MEELSGLSGAFRPFCVYTSLERETASALLKRAMQ